MADFVLPIGSIGPVVGEEGTLNLVKAIELSSNQRNAEYGPHHPSRETTSYEPDRSLKESAR
jgi:hypothetical protein